MISGWSIALSAFPEGGAKMSKFGPERLWTEAVLARFAAGTLDRVRAVKKAGETMRDFIRTAVTRELERREKPKKG